MDALLQTFALEKLHHDVGRAVVRDAMVEGLHHIGALDLCGDARLALEPSHNLRIVPGELFGDELDCYVGVKRQVFGNPNRTHRTFAQRFGEPHVGRYHDAWLKLHVRDLTLLGAVCHAPCAFDGAGRSAGRGRVRGCQSFHQ